MNMNFKRKLPIPMEIKEKYPVTWEIQKLKEKRDEEIKAIFEGRDNRFILIIGPCSADKDDSVLDYIYRLREVQEKVSDKILIKCGIIVSFIGIIVFALPLGKLSLTGFLLIGMGFGPIFPTILHTVPDRFGKKYSADLTGYHMGGAYGIGFFVQLIYGFTATETTFKITPYVLLLLCTGVYLTNETAIRKTLKAR